VTKIHAASGVNAGVDWCTATTTTKGGSQRLWAVGESLLHAGEGEGETPTRWHGHGYDGWAIPGVRLGSRRHECILSLSSSKARDQWQEAVAASENVSRLDLAVDAKFDPPVTTLAQQIYDDAGHVSSGMGRPPKRTVITGSDGGSTVYIGARSSEQFGRCYDKGVEQNLERPGHWWRWELELKQAPARTASRTLSTHATPTVWLYSIVTNWFARRTGHSLPLLSDAQICNLPRQASSSDATLKWLAQSVRPSILRLLETVPRERVLFSLGLLPQSAVEMSDPPVTPDEVS